MREVGDGEGRWENGRRGGGSKGVGEGGEVRAVEEALGRGNVGRRKEGEVGGGERGWRGTEKQSRWEGGRREGEVG